MIVRNWPAPDGRTGASHRALSGIEAKQPLVVSETAGTFNVLATVRGGGVKLLDSPSSEG